jgi:asparagine synthase (glutamine-hydrolysing)
VCGIYGFKISPIAESQNEADQLADSLEEHLAHRGPDSKGHKILQNFFVLGHTRLAFNDLSDAGNQPMYDYSGRFCIVMNGEIYNFKELRSELLSIGLIFNGTSDTEVVVKGFAIFGTNFLLRLRGMFAIAIFDNQKNQMTLCRDYFGEKPLWYTNRNIFGFASEYSIVEKLLETRTLSRNDCLTFLEFGYLNTVRLNQGPIKSVMPGSIVQIDLLSLEETLTSRTVTTKRTFEPMKSEDWKEYVERVDFVLNENVRKIVDSSDVEIGILLSGGVDSNLVASYLSKLRPKSKAFTLIFQGQNQAKVSQEEITENWGLDLHELVFSSDFELIKETISKMPLPLADSSALAQYQICKFASNFVKSCITGDGADELFAGYETYQASLLVSKIPRIARKSLSKLSLFGKHIILFELLNFHKNRNALTIQEKLFRLVRFIDENPLHSHYNWRRIFEPKELIELSEVDEIELIFDAQIPDYLETALDSNSFQSLDLENWLVDDILLKTDSMSMANSLELRTPFLSQEILELAFSLNTKDRLDFRFRKKVLYELLKSKAPERAVSHRKIGFGIPLLSIVQTNISEIREIVLQSNLWKEKGVNSLIKAPKNSVEARKIYTIFVISYWFSEIYRNKQILKEEKK